MSEDIFRRYEEKHAALMAELRADLFPSPKPEETPLVRSLFRDVPFGQWNWEPKRRLLAAERLARRVVDGIHVDTENISELRGLARIILGKDLPADEALLLGGGHGRPEAS